MSANITISFLYRGLVCYNVKKIQHQLRNPSIIACCEAFKHFLESLILNIESFSALSFVNFNSYKCFVINYLLILKRFNF